MTSAQKIINTIVICLLALALTPVVNAKSLPQAVVLNSAFDLGRTGPCAHECRVNQSGMSLDQAVAMVQSRYGARALKANSVEENGRVVHYIRLITADKSRVWTVRVDAVTGREI